MEIVLTRPSNTNQEQELKPSAKDKPSRGRSPRKDKSSTRLFPTRSRHAPFFEDFYAYFRRNNDGVPPPTGGREGQHLKNWLKNNRAITREQWQAILGNRERSPAIMRQNPDKLDIRL
jgi:hypothetical protein